MAVKQTAGRDSLGEKKPKRHNGCFGYYTTSSGVGTWESVARDEKLWYDINHVPQRTEPALTSRMENGMRVGLSPESEEGREIAALHRRWLTLTGDRYDPARHRGIVELYVMDQRFTAYYDKHLPGRARFLRDAVVHWVK